jgi:hypothetical protein
MATRFFLLEIEGWNPATQAVETLRFTDGDGLRDGDDWYVPALFVPEEVLYGRSLFADGRTGGASEITISDGLALLDADGVLDPLQHWGWDGRAARLYLIAAGQPRSAAILVLSATLEQLLPVYRVAAGEAEAKLVLRLKDPLSRFDVPLQPVKYAGSNVGPTGLEGTADDIKGLPKPIAYGRCFEVPGRWANTSELVLQWADGALAEIEPKWDNGVPLVLDQDHATPALLLAGTPGSGEYDTCLAQGYSRLGANPAGTITADISTVATPLPSGDAVQLDGTDDQWRRASAIVGAGATDRGTVSLWFRVDGGDGTVRTLLWLQDATAETAIEIRLTTANKIQAEWVNEGGESNGTVTSTSAYAAGGGWHHLALSWIFAPSPTAALWIDGANQTNAALIASPGPLDPLGGGSRIGAAGVGSPEKFFPGALAELWVGWGQFVDVTVASGRERFRSVAGWPVDLGPTGARPTGTSPTIYLRGGPAAFPTNLGTGGDFAAEGAPALASSTPYAPPPAVPSTVVASEIVRDVATARVGLEASEIDGDAFDQAALDAPEEVGIWVADERSVRDVLDEVANSAGLAYWFRADGRLAVGRFGLPSGTPVATWGLDELVELERRPVTDTGFGLPAYSIVVEHSRIWQVADGNGLAGSVDAARRAYLEREYRQASAADNTVRAQHLLAPEFVFRTLIADPDDAQAFAEDRLALYSQRRGRWRARLAIDAATAAVDLFDVVLLQLPRFGLDGGQLFRVIGIESDFRGNRIDFDLWGGVYGPIRPDWLGRRTTVHPPNVIGSEAQLTVPFLGNRVTIHVPRTRLYLRPPALGDRATLHAPAVAAAYRVTVPALGLRATVRAPVAAPGAVVLQVPDLGVRAAVHDPALAPGAVAVAVPDLGLRATLYAPAVAAAYRVTVPALGLRATVRAPGLVYGQAVAVPALGLRATVHSPVVQSGDAFVVVPFLGDRATLHAPVLAAAYRVTVPALGLRATVHDPAATARATVAVPDLGLRATLHGPAVAASYRVTVPALGLRATVHAPVLVPDQLILVPALGDRTTLHAPTLAAAYRIAVGDLGLRITIHGPTVAAGDLRLTEAGDTRITEAGDAREIE